MSSDEESTIESDSPYEVIVLFDGYSNVTVNGYRANCSCTLIKSETNNIIVDTMTAWDGDRLVEKLKEHNLNCDDINYIICTHGHSDHIGCNYLFTNAHIHIIGYCVSKNDLYLECDFKNGEEYIINDYIKIIPTPGHTLQDVSVLVETRQGIIAITGDLFENEKDLLDDTIWKKAGSDSEELQLANREKILEIADFIVPGHGPMFKLE